MVSMFNSIGTASDLSHVIQLAVAPVFLLTAVGSILGVLSNRLSRIVDRARVLESRLESVSGKDRERMVDGLATLALRAKLINRAIALCTTTALLICTVVASLFIASLFTVEVGEWIAALFIAAMFLLIGALIYFLREVFTATRSVRIGPH